MKLFSFKKKPQAPPKPKMLSCTVVLKTRRTATDFSWEWQLASPAMISKPQAAHLDKLVQHFCEEAAEEAKTGFNKQTLEIVLPR